AEEYRAKMIEAAAEGDETLTNKYLEGESLSDEEIRKGLRERSIKNEIVLCMCGTAFKNKGVQALLDAIIEYMPSPIEMPDVKAPAAMALRRPARRAIPSRSRRSPSRF